MKTTFGSFVLVEQKAFVVNQTAKVETWSSFECEENLRLVKLGCLKFWRFGDSFEGDLMVLKDLCRFDGRWEFVENAAMMFLNCSLG
jgi:hypothetical protein